MLTKAVIAAITATYFIIRIWFGSDYDEDMNEKRNSLFNKWIYNGYVLLLFIV